MLDTLKSFLSEFGEGAKSAPAFEANDYRLAAAALLIHVMAIDGQEKPAELDRLRDILKAQFALDDARTDALIEAATTADREAIDLYRFTSLLNRELDEAERLRIVEMMWEIVYADGKMNEFEDNVVWRAADLLGISSRDRIEMRRRVSGDAWAHRSRSSPARPPASAGSWRKFSRVTAIAWYWSHGARTGSMRSPTRSLLPVSRGRR